MKSVQTFLNANRAFNKHNKKQKMFIKNRIKVSQLFMNKT